MKKLNLLFLLSVCLVLSISSCSQDDDFINPAPQTRSVQLCKTRAEANSVLVNYLELVGDKYVLNISEKDAEAIGVPTDLYTGTLNEIKGTNELISKLKEDPKMELQLTDPQVALKTRSVWEQSTPYAALAPSGTLTTNGQEEADSGLVWAPYGTKGIEFLCRANAAITPAYACRTYSSGSWQSKTAIGAIGTNTTVRVPLYVSSDYVKAAFSTTDSNGGMATYQGYK